MRREGGAIRACVHLLATAGCALLLIAGATPAWAITRQPPAPAPPPRPVPLATVDHPPVDNATSFDNGPRSSDKVALTFDADMTPGMLQQLRAGQVRSWFNQDVRDILDAERIPATIFLTGLWTETYPDIARSLAQDPLFEIGNHSWDHAAFRTPCYGLAAAGDREQEIARAEDEIAVAAGVRPTLYRFPGDCYNRADAALAAQEGLITISGDVRAGDGFNPSAAAITATVLRKLQPGSIVLMHIHGGPNAPMTAPALRPIIDGARQRGLGFATVSELLGRAPGATAPAPAPAETATDLLELLRSAPIHPPGVALPGARLRRPDRFLRARPNRAEEALEDRR